MRYDEYLLEEIIYTNRPRVIRVMTRHGRYNILSIWPIMNTLSRWSTFNMNSLSVQSSRKAPPSEQFRELFCVFLSTCNKTAFISIDSEEISLRGKTKTFVPIDANLLSRKQQRKKTETGLTSTTVAETAVFVRKSDKSDCKTQFYFLIFVKLCPLVLSGPQTCNNLRMYDL